MLSDVKKLLDIQEIDQEILELNQQLGRYPQIWERVKKTLTQAKEDLEKAERNLDRHHKERHRLEQKIRLFSEDLRRSQAHLTTVKTTKEYEAATKQTDTLKTKISALEEQGIELIGKDEPIAKSVEDAKAEFEKTQEHYKSEKGRIREQFNEKKERISELEAEKKRLEAVIAGEVMADYNRVFKAHPGSAVVAVREKSCGGCHFGLLPNDLLELHRGEKTVYCPNCNRILSHDEGFVPEEAASST